MSTAEVVIIFASLIPAELCPHTFFFSARYMNYCNYYCCIVLFCEGLQAGIIHGSVVFHISYIYFQETPFVKKECLTLGEL